VIEIGILRGDGIVLVMLDIEPHGFLKQLEVFIRQNGA